MNRSTNRTTLIENLRGIAADGESWGPEEDLKAVCKEAADALSGPSDSALRTAAAAMVESFADHADRCRACTINWQNLKAALYATSDSSK